MDRFYCPGCGTHVDVDPKHGGEVVSAYCLRHRAGVDGHTRPVYMTKVPAEVRIPTPEPVLA